jgi:hypothetical protein
MRFPNGDFIAADVPDLIGRLTLFEKEEEAFRCFRVMTRNQKVSPGSPLVASYKQRSNQGSHTALGNVEDILITLHRASSTHSLLTRQSSTA